MDDGEFSDMHAAPNEPVVISGGGLTAAVFPQGAALQDLRFADYPFSLVLGSGNAGIRQAGAAYLGTVVGRFANRISQGRFALDGQVFHLDRNDNGRHTLHGGSAGISTKRWEVSAVTADSVSLSVTDRGEETGFPGDCRISATYRVGGNGVLDISFATTCDRATPCSIAPHPYFCLDGSGDIRSHEIRIPAEHYLPVGRDLIPTGEITSVENTPLDLRNWQKMGGLGDGFDHHFCTADRRVPLRMVAEARSPASRISLTLETTEPGLQYYTGGGLPSPFAPFSGFCLEPHAWPDAPNRPEFPSSVIQPGETLVQRTRITFRRY